jgi:hypothetical protein
VKRLFATCLLFLSGALHANAGDRGAFRSAYAPQDVELDTDPQSAFWQGAPAVFAEVDSWGHVLPGYRTQVSSRWTKNNLYLLFQCPYEELYLKPSPNTAEETYGLWQWDVAELFIGSDFHNIRRYKEFEVSPQREWTDLDIILDLPDHTVGWTWNSGFGTALCVFRLQLWIRALQCRAGPFARTCSAARDRPIIGKRSHGRRP